ncbi:14971_t:CDS:1, partial [Acaulospora colombiana]
KKRRELRKLKKLHSLKKKHKHDDHVYESSRKSKSENLRKSSPTYVPRMSPTDIANKNARSPMDIMNLLLVSDDNDVAQTYGSDSNSASSVCTPTSTPPSTPDSMSPLDQQTHKLPKIMSSGLKSKGNSFARVMIDRGVSDHSSISTELNNINPSRIPSTPHLEWEDLIRNIEDMNLDTSNLDNIVLNIQWKSNPLEISHLQRYEVLHKTEAK